MPFLYWDSTSSTFLRASCHDLLLVLRDDHVVDTDRDAGLHGGLEAELLELVERLDGHAVTRHLVGVEDEVAELALRHREVDEAETDGPDLVEDHAADGRAQVLALLVAVDGVLAEIRVRDLDPVVHLQRAVGILT